MAENQRGRGQAPESRRTSSISPFSGGPKRSRRQSTSERIDEILETARERAEASSTSLQAVKTSSTAASRTQLTRSPDLIETGEESSAAIASDAVVDEDEDAGRQRQQDSLRLHSSSRTGGVDGGVKSDDTRLTHRASNKTSIYARQSSIPSRSSVHLPRQTSLTTETQPGNESAEPWWRTTVNKFRSVELENKGSVARDHLALERTFLAWLRTSLAFASIGVAVTQLFRLNSTLDNGRSNHTLRYWGRPLGATFLVISILTLLLGCRRYFESQHWIIRGKFPASRGTIMVIAFIAFAIMGCSLVVVIIIHPPDSVSSDEL